MSNKFYWDLTLIKMFELTFYGRILKRVNFLRILKRVNFLRILKRVNFLRIIEKG